MQANNSSFGRYHVDPTTNRWVTSRRGDAVASTARPEFAAPAEEFRRPSFVFPSVSSSANYPGVSANPQVGSSVQGLVRSAQSPARNGEAAASCGQSYLSELLQGLGREDINFLYERLLGGRSRHVPIEGGGSPQCDVVVDTYSKNSHSPRAVPIAFRRPPTPDRSPPQLVAARVVTFLEDEEFVMRNESSHERHNKDEGACNNNITSSCAQCADDEARHRSSIELQFVNACSALSQYEASLRKVLLCLEAL